MAWISIREALESARDAGLIGYDMRCQALIDAGEYEAADSGDLVQVARPAERKTAEVGTSTELAARPGGGRHVRRWKFTVVTGGRPAAFNPPRSRPRSGAVGLRLITENGERVHSAASA